VTSLLLGEAVEDGWDAVSMVLGVPKLGCLKPRGLGSIFRWMGGCVGGERMCKCKLGALARKKSCLLVLSLHNCSDDFHGQKMLYLCTKCEGLEKRSSGDAFDWETWPPQAAARDLANT